MDNEKKHKLLTIIGGGLFILGSILCANRASQIISHKIVGAKVLAVEEFSGECRRVSGKYGTCTMANVDVEFPINPKSELRTGKIVVEHSGPSLVPGSSLKVMFLDGKPETVRLADFSSGWKGPLGVLFVGSLILIISRAGKVKAG